MVIWATACVVFYGLMRTGEFTTWDRLQFDGNHQACRCDFHRGWDSTKNHPFWSLHLSCTKTGLPGDVFLGFSGDFDCPCSALDNMFRVLPSGLNDPAFCKGPDTPLTRSTFIDAIRKPLASMELGYGIHGHSFHIGSTILLAAAGYPDHILQLAGCWQSLTFLCYIQCHDLILPQTIATLAAHPFPSSWPPPLLRHNSLGYSVVVQPC